MTTFLVKDEIFTSYFDTLMVKYLQEKICSPNRFRNSQGMHIKTYGKEMLLLVVQKVGRVVFEERY